MNQSTLKSPDQTPKSSDYILLLTQNPKHFDPRQRGNDLREQTLNQQGTFISAIRIQYIPNDKLTGIMFSFQNMASISLIQIVINKPDKLSPSDAIIDSTQYSNLGQSTSSKAVTMSKSYISKNTFTNQPLYTNSYHIVPGISVTPLSLDSSSIQRLDQKSQQFLFGQQVKTTTLANKEIQITAPSCKNVKITSVIQQQFVKLGYQAILHFSNRYNGDYIGNKTVKGIWDGVMTSAAKDVITQKPIDGCLPLPNKITIDQLVNSRWKFYNSDKFLGYMIFKKDGTIGEYDNTNQRFWSFDKQLVVSSGDRRSNIRYVDVSRDYYGKWQLVSIFGGPCMDAQACSIMIKNERKEKQLFLININCSFS